MRDASYITLVKKSFFVIIDCKQVLFIEFANQVILNIWMQN